MIAFWALIVVAVGLLDRARADRIRACTEKSAYELYALRDELREAVAVGQVRCRNWVFEYLDSSIAKTIGVLPSLNVWALTYLAFAYRHNPRILRAEARLDRELAKLENAFLADIHRRYIDVVGQCLLERHFVVRWCLVVPIHTAARLSTMWRRAVELSTEVPETSTLNDFEVA